MYEDPEEEYNKQQDALRQKLKAEAIDILVCYIDGVIETNTYEWELFEGIFANDQTLCGWVIDLRDLKG